MLTGLPMPSHPKKRLFDKLLGRIHPGAIVLLHNTSKTNGEILDELLNKWESMGYQFSSLKKIFLKTESNLHVLRSSISKPAPDIRFFRYQAVLFLKNFNS